MVLRPTRMPTKKAATPMMAAIMAAGNWRAALVYTEQSSPTWLGPHQHCPYLHRPWPEQSFGHVTACEQSSPVRPGLQKHWPLAHTPWLLQPLGHDSSVAAPARLSALVSDCATRASAKRGAAPCAGDSACGSWPAAMDARLPLSMRMLQSAPVRPPAHWHLPKRQTP